MHYFFRSNYTCLAFLYSNGGEIVGGEIVTLAIVFYFGGEIDWGEFVNPGGENVKGEIVGGEIVN